MTFVASVGLLVLFALSVFQMLLIIGRPYGDFAWGGQHQVLSKKLRIASVFSLLLYALFAIFLASSTGIVNIVSSESTLRTGMWIFTGYFTVGVFLNAISRNKKERMLMTPVALVLAVVFLVTTLTL